MGIKWSSLLGLQSYLQMISVSKEGIAGYRPPAFEKLFQKAGDYFPHPRPATNQVSPTERRH
jgi:hypothetical protein